MPTESSGDLSNYESKNHVKFSDFKIPQELLERLTELGFDKPFEIQEKTLKHTLEGADLVGKAFTGSGKTLAFAIPIITRIMNSTTPSTGKPRCLVLSPTRELCLQLTKSIAELAPKLRCVSIYGGAGMQDQMRALETGVDIVCATPGRLGDLMQRKCFRTDDIEIICLDEADELLKKSFIDQITEVIEISNKKQMLMFSATINHEVVDIVRKFMSNPVTIDLTKGQKYKLPTNIEHFIVRSPYYTNLSLIQHYINEHKSERCIVFSNTKRNANQISERLRDFRIRSSDIHSDKTQFARQQILSRFRSGAVKVLVATDVAARGLDIPEVDLIIQIGAPQGGVEAYIHRSGRTGRAGRVGRTVLILNKNEEEAAIKELSRIIKFKELQAPANLKNTNRQPRNESFEEKEEEDEDSSERIQRSSYKDRTRGFSGSRGGYNDSRFSNRYSKKRQNDFEE